MTLTFRTSRRAYQTSPRGAPDGVLSNALARLEVADGEIKIDSEANRARIFSGSNPFTADHVGRLVTLFLTPQDLAGAAGERRYDGWTFRITDWDNPTGNWIEVEGFRADLAGTGMRVIVHASVDLTAASAAFYEDEGPYGPTTPPSGAAASIVAGAPTDQVRVTGLSGLDDTWVGQYITISGTDTRTNSGLFEIAAQTGGTQVDIKNANGVTGDANNGSIVWSVPHRKVRTNTGPVLYQCIYFPLASDGSLRAFPFQVSDRLSATSVRLCVPWDTGPSTLPTESSLTWVLKDRAAVNPGDLYKLYHQFILQCGWEMHQSRGRNEKRNLMFDNVYFSTGEDGRKKLYLRFVAGKTTQFGDSGSNDHRNGFDWALFSVWDRDFDNSPISAAINPGNGINACSETLSVQNAATWAAQADDANTTGSGSINGGAWSTDEDADGTVFNDYTGWGPTSVVPGDDANKAFRTTLNTPEEAELYELHWTGLGDRDEVHLFSMTEHLGGSKHIGWGELAPRPEANDNRFTTQAAITAGAAIVVRVGDDIDPETPPQGQPMRVGDQVQIVGQTVNLGVKGTATQSHAGEFIESSIVQAFLGRLGSIGSFEVPAGASVNDGDFITIGDGQGNSEQYEWDNNASAPTNPLTFVGGETADQIRDIAIEGINPTIVANYTWNGTTTITTGDTSEATVGEYLKLKSDGQMFEISAITPNVDITILNPHGLTIPTGSGANNSARSKVQISATSGGSAKVQLDNTVPGDSGDVAMSETGSTLVSLAGMEGGGWSVQVAQFDEDYAKGALFAEDPQAIYVTLPMGRGGQATDPFVSGTTALIVGNRSSNNDATYHNHNGPTMASGNGFGASWVKTGNFGMSNINPNNRTGRFEMVDLQCVDTGGDEVRGLSRYMHVVNGRIGVEKLVRARDGGYFMLLRPGWQAEAISETSRFSLAIGPMPEEMALVS